MLAWLASFLTGPLIQGALDAYKARLAAANAGDRIAADLAVKEIEAEIEARKSAQATIIAEQGRWWTAAVRPLWTAPFVVYTWKVVVWDICLGWGTTDAIRGDLATLMMIVAGTYFSGRTIEKVAQVLRRGRSL
jgi:hypothetical protein